MAEAAAGAVVEEVVKCAVPPIKRGFNYLCCFTANINNLEKEAKRLDDAAAGLQLKVDGARDNVEDILPEVTTLLDDDYNKIKDQKTAILVQVPNVGSVCLNLRARFSLSKRAKKTTDRMKELRDECSKYSSPGAAISQPGAPAASKPVQLGKTYEFESRKQIEEDIMALLKGGDVSMIGICGMGGLGKTTMAKRIMNKVLEERIFEEAVFAVVSQPIDKSKIRLDIGGQLGLKLQDEPSETVRIQKLHERLSGTKRILLVLDDVWEGIELEEFGIPRDSKGCTSLITSRNSDALRAMDVEKEFGMKILSEEEARFLFREKAGTCMDDAQLKSIAEEIVKECEGLPIALAIVGAALKDQKSLFVWRDALNRLRRRNPGDFIEKVYNPLKLSYDFLSSKEAKSLFLLCCLFPEDADIPLEFLAYFGLGLDIYEGITNLEELTDRVSTLVTQLKGRSLLLDSEEGDDYVTMHDIVRDVCISIAKQEGRVEGDNCSWISSFEHLGEGTKQLPTGLGSNLNLLILSCPHSEEAPKLDNTIFEGISDLRVLCIQNYWSLPPTHSLKNITCLVLYSCHGLETISAVGKFINLEILICCNSSSIEELPLEIKELDRLKLLELTCCKNLQRIGLGIISSLLALEELKMLDSFNRWESKDREERKNAGLRELESLTNLRCLEIDIKDPALASEMRLSSEIKKFVIRIGSFGELGFSENPFNKTIFLDFKSKGPCAGNSIFEMQLLNDTEDLYLTGNDASSVDLAKCRNIRRLKLRDCETITLIVGVQASLERLKLDNLPILEWICEGPISSNSFHNLKELKLNRLPVLKQLWKSSSGRPLFPNISSIKIKHCGSLCNLGELSIAGKGCLPQLEELVIKNCEMMEQVFLRNNEDEIRKDSESQNDHSIKKVFPKLVKVWLLNLSNLAFFYQGIGGFEFPLLKEMSIKACPKLKGMGCSVDIDDDDDSWHLFCQPEKVSFGNLKEIEVDQWNLFCGHEIHESLLNGLEVLNLSSLPGSTSLFSSLVSGNLGNLRVLNIRECDEMLKVIEDNKEVVSGIAERPFPKLEELLLADLPKLVAFCEWKCDVELHSLREVIINGCPNMKNLSLGFLAAPKLVHFDSDFNNNLETEVSFDSLKKLEISRIEKPLYGHKFFDGLEELEVSGTSMSFLFTSSIARRFDNLEVLSIGFCDEMVKVIEDEDEEKVASGGVQRTYLFPKLRKLELNGLSKLVSFCAWKCDYQLPSLRNLVIEDCPILGILTTVFKAAPCLENVEINLKDIVGDRDNWNSVLQQLEYMKHTARVKVSFNDLKYLSLSNQWNPFYGHQIPSSLLNGLEDLTFYMLHGCTSLFSSSVAGNLVNLWRLKITNCDEMLKVIEDNKELMSSTVKMVHILFPKLEELSLEKLPKLVTFCEWKCNDELPSLRKVTIKGCPDMEILSFSRVVAAQNLEAFTTDFMHNLEIGVVDVSFDSLKKLEISRIEKPLYGHKFFDGLEELQVSNSSMSCLFSSSTARDFDNLEVLSIEYCHKMVKVIEDEENEEKVGSGGGERTNLFPKLRKLELNYLPKLVSFCEWKCDYQLPSLRNLVIKDCPVLGIHTTVFIAAPCLENVEINLKDIVGDRDYLNSMLQQLDYMKHTARVKVSFNDLKYLSLSEQWNPFYGHQIPSSLLNGLEDLTFSKLHGSTSLFSLSVAGNLVNLRRLRIANCDEMLTMIEDNKELMSSTAEMVHILFPKLEELSLEELPKLVTFCEWKCNDELPSLRKVTIKGCPDMEILSFSRVVAAQNLEAFTTDFTHNLEIGVVDVSLDSLKKLVIRFRYSEQPLYCHKCFNGLKELKVSACSMSCLFTSSTARRLENLEVLSIKFCYEMVKVIEDEEEEKMGSGGGERTLLFPKLKTLKLDGLPKLVSFCEWKCDIEFPSLRDVVIHMCPDLRIFTMGSIAAAPNLVNVKINNEDVGGDTNDMNSVAQENMVSFNSLKKLMIERSEKPLYGHKFFNGLKELQVSECSMSCLFTSSTARRFVNLEVLSIKFCYKMVKVIEDEEEKVGSGERTLLFPKLNKLELDYLPKLESFCEWKCDIELPSLRDVVIGYCRVLRNFSMGSIAAAPKLENVIIEHENIGSDTKELNSVAQENMKRTKDDDDE